MVTVRIPDADVSRTRYDALDPAEAVPSLLAKRVEQYALAPGTLVECNDQNAFAWAAHEAFYKHLPLRIRPDDVWFCIAQGFATHVNENVESLRKRFVAHEGKEKLVVVRPDFFLGQDNPWPEAFDAFADQIGEHVGKLKDLLCADFTTTTLMERAAYAVTAMDTFQGYFEYEMLAGCGIPSYEVVGTAEDWRSIVTRTRHLSEYGLEAWTDALVPVLERIARTVEGEVDIDFWRSFFRYQAGSGPAELTGWILTLFPYVKKGWDAEGLGFNPYLANWRDGWSRASTRKGWMIDKVEGPWLGALPGSLASAPVKYTQLPEDVQYALRFVSGMFGVHQAPELGTLSPAFGWAIVYDEA